MIQFIIFYLCIYTHLPLSSVFFVNYSSHYNAASDEHAMLLLHGTVKILELDGKNF